jgi:predicted DNA-binding antitoxin AbrB/MazE fold protein
MNALNYEEAVHKLLKVQLQEGQEVSSSLEQKFQITHLYSLTD